MPPPPPVLLSRVHSFSRTDLVQYYANNGSLNDIRVFFVHSQLNEVTPLRHSDPMDLRIRNWQLHPKRYQVSAWPILCPILILQVFQFRRPVQKFCRSQCDWGFPSPGLHSQLTKNQKGSMCDFFHVYICPY